MYNGKMWQIITMLVHTMNKGVKCSHFRNAAYSLKIKDVLHFEAPNIHQKYKKTCKIQENELEASDFFF